jgi:hypothetical protein
MHRAGCFLLPNTWDAGSARILQTLGYKALATTSSGYAWSQAHADGQLSRSDTLAHMRYMVAISDLSSPPHGQMSHRQEKWSDPEAHSHREQREDRGGSYDVPAVVPVTFPRR